MRNTPMYFCSVIAVADSDPGNDCSRVCRENIRFKRFVIGISLKLYRHVLKENLGILQVFFFARYVYLYISIASFV